MADDKPTYRITDLAVSERPRERLVRLGAQSLSNAELLAILLRVGVPGGNTVQVGHRLLQTRILRHIISKGNTHEGKNNHFLAK